MEVSGFLALLLLVSSHQTQGQTCSHGDVRLTGGESNRVGRVEICLNNQWGAVCDTLWDQVDAATVCRQLGFSYTDAIARRGSVFGSSGLPILATNVNCGSFAHTRLIDCSIRTTSVVCDADSEASAVCCPCCSHGDVRLVGGSSAREGRVELCDNGVWGTVCHVGFGEQGARVVCRQLGFLTNAGVIARYNAYFGQGTIPIRVSQASCSGTENRLVDCGVRYGNDICTHQHDVGVTCLGDGSATTAPNNPVCNQGDIRLQGGANSLTGRVEVCNNNVWGTVCDDFWDAADAQVACRQLGFATTGAVALASGFPNGASSQPIWLDNVQCSGAETRLTDCPANTIGSHNCVHSEDAGVRCPSAATPPPTTPPPPTTRPPPKTLAPTTSPPATSPPTTLAPTTSRMITSPTTSSPATSSPAPTPGCSQGDLRLVGGSSSLEGRVELCHNGVWGTVCDNLWDGINAMVVCRQLGFSPNGALGMKQAAYGQGSGPILLNNVRCTGSEATLLQCPADPIGSHNCVHSEDAGVRCLSQTGAPTATAPTTSPGISFQEVSLFSADGSSVPIAGGTHTLVCTVSHANTLSPAPLLEVEWLDSENNPITADTDSFTLSGESSSTASSLTSRLTFLPVRTSQGGEYTCASRMTVQNSATIYRVTNTTSIIVQVPAPTVVISPLEAPIRGTTVRLQAVSTLSSNVNTNTNMVGTFERLGSPLSRFASSASDTQNLQEHTKIMTFNPLSDDSGTYRYTITVTPSDSTYIRGTSTQVNYILSVEAYPALQIKQSFTTGDCMAADVVTLRGSITLLPNTAPSHSLSYTWIDTARRPISTSSGDFTVFVNTLQVANLRTNQGDYTLSACLNIVESNINTCVSSSYTISNNEPGQVANLACQSLDVRGTGLSISWGLPSANSDSVGFYEVGVREYYQQEGSKEVLLRPLTPAYTRSVSTDAALSANVSSGIAGSIPYQVSVTPRNAAGCGTSNSITCFSAEGVPTKAPEEVRITRSESDPTIIIVTWQPLTLVEAKGPNISYVMTLDKIASRKRQSTSKVLSGSMNTTTFENTDSTVSHVVSVGTITSSGARGPVTTVTLSRLSEQAAATSAGTAAGIAVGVVLAMVIVTVIVVIAVVIFTKKRNTPFKPSHTQDVVIARNPLSDPNYEDIDEKEPEELIYDEIDITDKGVHFNKRPKIQTPLDYEQMAGGPPLDYEPMAEGPPLNYQPMNAGTLNPPTSYEGVIPTSGAPNPSEGYEKVISSIPTTYVT